jgi:hypothetical protein
MGGNKTLGHQTQNTCSLACTITPAQFGSGMHNSYSAIIKFQPEQPLA